MKYEIVGDLLPAVRISLDKGETIISEVGGRTWSLGDITTETKGGGAGAMIGRAFSGESLFLSYYTANEEAEIVFSSSFPGSIRAYELEAGESIICQKRAFLASTDTVSLNAFMARKLSAGLVGGEGFILQELTGPGTVFVEIDGFAIDYTLEENQKIVCDTGVMSIMDKTCTMSVQQVKGLKNKFLGGEGLFDTVITGPGKVTLQSMKVGSVSTK